MKHRLLTFALLGSLAAAPCAFAQDQDTSWATTSGSRFAITGGYTLSEPTGGIDTGAGTSADLDGDGAATLGATWFVNDNVAIEAWGTDAFGHRVTMDGAKAGSVNAQPYALSAQYHFGAPSQTVRPFVGLGYYQMNFDEETPQAGGPFAGQRVGLETSQGAMATVGADFNISPRWFARTDLRYLHGSDTDLLVDGEKAGSVDANPVMLGVGVGVRF